jgi:hypothetical protein
MVELLEIAASVAIDHLEFPATTPLGGAPKSAVAAYRGFQESDNKIRASRRSMADP